MVYTTKILFEPILGVGSARCQRCGRLLTNSKSIERGYGPVCWKKIEFELWLGDASISDAYMSQSRARRKIQTHQLVEPLIAAQRTLDEFFFEQIEPHLAAIPTQTAVLAEG